MLPISPVNEPSSKDELRRDFAAVRAWSEAFWLAFEPAEFFAPIGEAWSPADNVRHLLKSNRPVVRALKLPKLVLLLRFGVSRRKSRSYSELIATYHEALGGGLTAGRFAARPLAAEEQTPALQKGAVAELSGTLEGLASAFAKWSDLWLDRLRLPHPGLGLLTVREMLFFTLYHNTHHVMGVAKGRERIVEPARSAETHSAI